MISDRRQPASKEHSPFDMEAIVGFILLAGVILSVLLLAAGLFWRWKDTGHVAFDYSIQAGNLLQFWKADIGQALSGAFQPRLLINLGIGILLFTPYLRVLISTFYFAFIERNLKYTGFTAFVLAVLTYTLLLR